MHYCGSVQNTFHYCFCAYGIECVSCTINIPVFTCVLASSRPRTYTRVKGNRSRRWLPVEIEGQFSSMLLCFCHPVVFVCFKGIPGLAATGHDSSSFGQDVSPTARMALAKSLPQAVRGLLPPGQGALVPPRLTL